MEMYDQGLFTTGQIDSLLKLRLVLLFTENPWLRMNTITARQRVGESPWALSEALDELADAGFLVAGERFGQREYWLTALPDRRIRLERLARTFDDPQRRDDIYDLTRAASDERRFHELGAPRLRAMAVGEFDGFVF